MKVCFKETKYTSSAIHRYIPKYPLCEEKNRRNNCKDFEKRKPAVVYHPPKKKFLGIF